MALAPTTLATFRFLYGDHFPGQASAASIAIWRNAQEAQKTLKNRVFLHACHPRNGEGNTRRCILQVH
jgi:hypothetical protein